MVKRPAGRSGTGRDTLGEVWDGLGDPRGGPERVGGPSGRSRTVGGSRGEVREVRGTLGEVQYGSWVIWRDLGRVG